MLEQSGARRRAERFIPWAIWLGFWSLYWVSIGTEKRNLPWYNFVFDADPARVISDALQGQNPVVFERHPLFTLTIGALARVFDIALTSPQSILCAVSCIAGAGVAGAFVFFRRSAALVPALGFALLYGVSATHWILASIPETFAVNSAVIVGTFLMHRAEYSQPKQHPLRFSLKALLAALGTGVSVPNFVYAMLGHLSSLRTALPTVRRRVASLAGFFVATLVLLALLGALQRALFPQMSAGRKVVTTPVAAAARDPLLQAHPVVLSEVAQLTRAFTVDNLVAPPTVVETRRTYDGPLTMIQYGGLSPLYVLTMLVLAGFALAVLWRGSLGDVLRDHTVQLALACVAFNLVFHYFYRAMGQPFIFTIHTVFPWLVIVAKLYEQSVFRFKIHVLAATTLLVTVNNIQFVRSVNYALEVPCSERLGHVCLVWQGHANDPRFTRGTSAFRQSADFPFETGRVEFVADRYAQSIPHFQRAMEIEPAYMLPRLYLGSALIQTNRFDDALAHLQASLALSPGNRDLERLIEIARQRSGTSLQWQPGHPVESGRP
jgi:hypothetical protein